MKKEALSIFINQCRRNKFIVLILVMIYAIIGAIAPIVAMILDSTSFYLSNSGYNILLSKAPATMCKNESYYIRNDFILLKQEKVIDAQGIMLKEDGDYSSIFHIKSLSKKEMIVSKKIALENNIVVGDYIDVELNYTHKVVKYRVVGISEYLFDMTQDINILSSPMFFVGYDEEYVDNSMFTYLSFYDINTEISAVISVENIIKLYRCKSRAAIGTFVLGVLTIGGGIVLLVGYYLYSKTLEKKNVFKIIRNSGITQKSYHRFVFLFNGVSFITYCLPLALIAIIGCVWSVKYLLYTAVVLVFILIYQVIENYVAHKDINFLGVDDD